MAALRYEECCLPKSKVCIFDNTLAIWVLPSCQNYVLAIKCVDVFNEDVFEEPENMEQESIPIRETLKIHKIERSEMKGIYGLKFFYLAEDEKPFFTQWYANGKDVLVCGHDDGDVDTNHCAACLVEYDKAEEWIQCPGLREQWFHEQCFYN